MTNWRWGKELLCPFMGRRKKERKMKGEKVECQFVASFFVSIWLRILFRNIFNTDYFSKSIGFESIKWIHIIFESFNYFSQPSNLLMDEFQFHRQLAKSTVDILSTISTSIFFFCLFEIQMQNCAIHSIPIDKCIKFLTKRLVKFMTTDYIESNVNTQWKRHYNNNNKIIMSDAAPMTDCVLRLSIFGKYIVVVCLMFDIWEEFDASVWVHNDLSTTVINIYPYICIYKQSYESNTQINKWIKKKM